jgi:hypothetical protein
VGQIVFFALGVILTMAFVVANVREERMNKDAPVQKMVTGDLGKAVKPPAMTPLIEGNKPQAMTPIMTGTENAGIQSLPVTPTGVGGGPKPAPMTPAPSQGPAKPAPGNRPTSDKK